jgi:CheY-specific phosphatase CheX
VDVSHPRPDERPDSGPIGDALFQPFVDSVRTALLEMAGIEVAIRSTSGAASPGAGDIIAVVELTSTPPMTLMLSFPGRTAEALAAQILTDVKVTTDDVVTKDCVREIANVVAGQAKTALSATPHHFSCSLPTIADVTPMGAAEGFFAAFDSPAGEFGLLLASAKRRASPSR